MCQVVVVPILRPLSWTRRHAVVGATWMEKSLSPAVLSELSKVCQNPLPLSTRSASLGRRLLDSREGRSARRSSLRPCHSLHSRALRRMALFLDDPSGFDRDADHGNDTEKRRPHQHRRPLRRRRLQLAVSLLPCQNFVDRDVSSSRSLR